MAQNDEKHIMLMADCLPVKGSIKSAIYDLGRGDIHTFPTDFFDVFEELENHPYGDLKKMVTQTGHLDDFESLIEFLYKNDIIYFLSKSEKDLFPKIDLDTWERPCVIQNAIIDISDVKFDFSKIISQLDALGCEYLQIRQYGNGYSIGEVDSLLKLAYNTSIQSVELLLQFDDRIDEQRYRDLLLSHPIIVELNIHSSPANKMITINFEKKEDASLQKSICFSKTQVTSSDHCGVISQRTLNAPTTNVVTEFRGFNGCLNRKISIDQNGNIKNCPSMKTSYGAITDTTLTQALAHTDFKTVWGIKKDDITDCNVCEYRYVCSDCRAFTQDGSMTSKPAKCQYNPHTALWV